MIYNKHILTQKYAAVIDSYRLPAFAAKPGAYNC